MEKVKKRSFKKYKDITFKYISYLYDNTIRLVQK